MGPRGEICILPGNSNNLSKICEALICLQPAVSRSNHASNGYSSHVVPSILKQTTLVYSSMIPCFQATVKVVVFTTETPSHSSSNQTKKNTKKEGGAPAI